MTFTSLRNGLLLIFVLVFMSACALLPCETPAPPPEPEPETDEPEVAPPPPPPPPPPPEPDDFIKGEDQQGRPTLIVVDEDGNEIPHSFNFDFDEADLASADFSWLNRHAEVLVNNRDRSVTIEGHCDERGTREYNLALGERRAQAVADYLRSAGVRASQISTVSFGEESPVDAASTEEAWAKNRRAVIRLE